MDINIMISEKILYILVKNSIFLHKLLKRAYRGPTSFVNDLPIDLHFDYGIRCVDDYFSVINQLSCESISGDQVLEIGTGMSPVVACLMAKRGFAVISLDRFNNIGDIDSAMNSVCQKLNVDFCKISVADYLVDGKRVKFVHQAIEDINEEFVSRFNLVISRATLEHFTNLTLGIQVLKMYSASGAIHLHEVDHRDHGLFSHFLVVSNMWFHRISRKIWSPLLLKFPGLPNKYNANELIQIFLDVGFTIVKAYERNFHKNDKFSKILLSESLVESSPVSVIVTRV
jgi:hypothetical protein